MSYFVSASRHDLASLKYAIYDHKNRRRLRLETVIQLGPVGLAWWFMDDGCKAKKAVRIAACRYPYEDVVAVCKWFNTEFGYTSMVNAKYLL